jgi:hypothetical protein
MSEKVIGQLNVPWLPNAIDFIYCAGSGHLVAFSRWLPALAIHDLIERIEVCPGLPILKEASCLQGRDLFSHSGSYKLVYAGSVLLAQPLNCLLKGTWQT